MKCPACASDVPDDAARCPRCDAALRDRTCPHCRASAGASPHAELRFACDVCGGPRVPLFDGSKRSGREIESLQRAESDRRARAVARGLGVIALVIGGGLFLAATMLTLVLGAHAPILAGAALVTVITLVLASSAFGNARTHGRAIGPAIEAAWMSAANDLAAAHGGALSAAQIKSALGVGDARAEELLALADVSAIAADRPPIRFEPETAGTPTEDAARRDEAAEREAAAIDEAAREQARAEAKRGA